MASSEKYQRFWLLVALKLDNEATEEESQELDALLRDDEELRVMMVRAQQMYHFKTEPGQMPDVDWAFSKHMQRLSNRLSKSSMPDETPVALPLETEPVSSRTGRRRMLLWTGAVAASLIIAFFVGHYEGKPKNYSTSGNPPANIVSTRYGSKSKLELPDGTQVWLNADSRLTYGKEFGNQSREVSLLGEAFFEVQKDADRPFIIHTGSMDIRVLGTAFNVRSYQNEKTSEATLVRGAIEIVLKENPDRKIVLKPSDRIVVQNKLAPVGKGQTAADGSYGNIYSMSKVNTRPADSADLENSWKRSGLSFRNETLENVAFRIEHWFNVKVDIQDEELKQGTYSCDFKHESLGQVLEALHFTGKFQYRIEKDSVTIFK